MRSRVPVQMWRHSVQAHQQNMLSAERERLREAASAKREQLQLQRRGSKVTAAAPRGRNEADVPPAAPKQPGVPPDPPRSMPHVPARISSPTPRGGGASACCVVLQPVVLCACAHR